MGPSGKAVAGAASSPASHPSARPSAFCCPRPDMTRTGSHRGSASEFETFGHFMKSILWSFTLKLRNVDVGSEHFCDLWAWCQHTKSPRTEWVRASDTQLRNLAVGAFFHQ